MVIPKGNDKTATFDAEEMKAAIRRVSLMADERTRSVKLVMKAGEIEISSQAAEEGEANEVIAADYNGEEVTLGFNSAYLQDFLSIIGANDAEAAPENENEGETVKVKDGRLRLAFDFKDSNAQTLIRLANDNGYDYKYIVMPLRI
jgi:DNA polymerase-3 subunit beta